jgi:hypothetical protein
MDVDSSAKDRPMFIRYLLAILVVAAAYYLAVKLELSPVYHRYSFFHGRSYVGTVVMAVAMTIAIWLAAGRQLWKS